MFSICRNCTKLINLSKLLNNNRPRSFSGQKGLHSNALFPVLLNNTFRRAFSSTIDPSAVENEEINYENITKGDKELEHKLKVLVLEAEVMRQEGKLVPPSSHLNEDNWKELLNLSTRSARKKYFEFLFKTSRTKENRLAKKLEKRKQFEAWKESRVTEERSEETIEEFVSKYDLQHNNLFLRFYDTTMNNMYNNRLIQAMMFGQKLVVDCGYHTDMTTRENLNCAKQLMLLFAENRLHNEPFDLHFCNADPQSLLIKNLLKFIPSLNDLAFPLTVHEESYLDAFPKDQLVYLTPHCREELTEFDHNAIYIVGAIVDKVNNQPLSLAKAKREGLKMAKLPLDRYLQWGSGSGKSLTLNQVVSILNDAKTTRDWEHALRHVPKRKIVEMSIGKNIVNATDRLHYDRPRRERKWVPKSNVNFNESSYDNRKKEKGRMVKIENIIND